MAVHPSARPCPESDANRGPVEPPGPDCCIRRDPLSWLARYEAINSLAVASGKPRAPTIRRSDLGYGFRVPRSRSPMARTLSPARSDSSSCVSLAASRLRRSHSPGGSAPPSSSHIAQRLSKQNALGHEFQYNPGQPGMARLVSRSWRPACPPNPPVRRLVTAPLQMISSPANAGMYVRGGSPLGHIGVQVPRDTIPADPRSAVRRTWHMSSRRP